jgi:hypothetical protein
MCFKINVFYDYLNFFPDISVFRNVVKKVTTFSARLHMKMIQQGVARSGYARKGMCPLLFGGGVKGAVVLLIAKKI